MQFKPKTDEEIQAEGLWPEGKYGFEIIDQVSFGDNILETKDTVSKSGNDMIQIVVRVYNDNGQQTHVIDYLLEAFSKKLKGAAYACGLGSQYESGQLEARDFIGKQGNLYLGIQKGRPKDDGSGNYPDRNTVTEYARDEQTVTNDAGMQVSKNHSSVQEKQELVDDDIPF